MKFFWDNIYQSRQERTRVIILIFIFLLLCYIKFYTVVFYEPTSIPVDVQVLDSIKMVSIEKKEKYYTKKDYDQPKEEATWYKKENNNRRQPKKLKSPINFRFNPNKINRDSLLMLGFPNYAANSLLKYRNKGGVIRSIDQMSKINGLDEATLTRLTPYIDLPKSPKIQYSNNPKRDPKTNELPKKKYARKQPKIFDINIGDTTDFMNLYGIGKVYSKRIIKYRNSLGGFFTAEQIKDVWGIEDSLYQSIKPYLTVDPSKIKKRNINNMNKDSLNKHPYINWQKSKTILAYKSAHGDYKDMDDFYKLHLLEDEFVDTMKLYFTVK